MTRNFILSYDYAATYPIKDQLAAYVSKSRNIIQWIQPFSGLYLLKSDVSLADLQQDFNSFFGPHGFFLALTDADDCGGWLPPYVWEWLRTPPANSMDWLLPQPIPGRAQM